MARKLTLDLTIEQTRMLHDIAAKRVVISTGDQLVRWQAIQRETARALTYAEQRTRRSDDDGT